MESLERREAGRANIDPCGRLRVTGPSPYVRRRWLAQEVRLLRKEHGYTIEELAAAVGFGEKQISALENGHLGPDVDLLDGICDYLQAGKHRRQLLMDAAADGWAVGWWVRDAARMGKRQARYADLESGTNLISEYAISLVPGLLQTTEYAAARMRSDPARQPDNFDPAVAVAARAHRQRLLLTVGGPTYDLVLDESAARSCAAEPDIVAAQLHHIIALCQAHPSITVRVLPVGATIKGHSAPRSTYSIYRYRDSHATLAVAAETLTTDLIITDMSEIAAYRELHSRLKAAALGPEASLHMLANIAGTFYPTEGVAA